jgi:hypothetical protein
MVTHVSAVAFAGFKSPPGALYWTGSVIVLSVGLWVATRRWRSHNAFAWVALALAGQACALQLLWVGNNVRLQLFWGWSDLLSSLQGIFLIALLLQVAIVAWGARRLYSGARRCQPQLLSWGQTLVFLLLAAFAAMTIHPGVPIALLHGGFARQVLVHASKVALGLTIFGVGAMNLILAASALPADIWNSVSVRMQQAQRNMAWVCAGWVVIASSVIAWVVLDRMPHVPDEVGYIFQAKYLAAGRLYLPPPPDVQAFVVPFQLIENGKWFGSPSVGWPIVLAAGYWLGVPWIVNPFLGGIAILLSHRLARRLYDPGTANTVAVLLAFSPWLLFLSASFMPHAVALVLTLLGLIGVQGVRENGSLGWATLAGLSIGALLHVRALEAVALAAAAAGWWLSAGRRRLRPAAIAATCVAGLIMTGLLLAYNKALVGDPLRTPINKFTDQAFYPGTNRLGFGADIGNFGWTGLDALPGHGPIDVAVNTNHNMYLVNFEMFGWPCGSLLFVLLLLVWTKLRSDTFLWAVILCLWAALSLYWFSGGPDFGARYWYLMIAPLAILTVRGAQGAAARLRDNCHVASAEARVWMFVALATAIGVVNVVPWRSLDKYQNYRGIRADVRQLEQKYQFGQSLVLVRGDEWDYASAIPLNPGTFGPEAAGPIYARDLGAASRERLQAYYPHRPIWIIAGPSVTKDGFKVVEGPMRGTAR